MSLFARLKAPNGREFDIPTGLFINNEWVLSSDGKTLSSVNPA
jgi:aldehyde dehydrogenase (NAD+)